MAIVVVASHSEMANGIKKTTEYIMGKMPNLYAIPAYTEGFENVEEALKKILKEHSNDQAYILTDLLGGSVNTEIKKMMELYPKAHLVTGVNLPLVMQLLLVDDTKKEKEITKAIEEAKKGIVYMNAFNKKEEAFDEF